MANEVDALVEAVRRAFPSTAAQDKYLASLAYDTKVGGRNGGETLGQIQKARQAIAGKPSAMESTPLDVWRHKQSIQQQFDSYTPAEQREVLNTGTLPKRFQESGLDFGPSANKAMAQLHSEVSPAWNLQDRINDQVAKNNAGIAHLNSDPGRVQSVLDTAELNRQIVNSQFGRTSPDGVRVGTDMFWPIDTPVSVQTAMQNSIHGAPNDVYAQAMLNPERSGALAEEMARLSELYPGIAGRMTHLGIGKTGNEGWNAMMGFLKNQGDPAGAVPYVMGMPGEPSRMRGDFSKPYRESPSLDLGDDWFAANPFLYPGQYEATAAHEFGHAVQGSMHDFVRGLDEGIPANAEAAQAYRRLMGRLGGQDASYLSRYAEQSRSNAGPGNWDAVPNGQASKEPFAELFSVARSQQGLDRYYGSNTGGLLNDMVGHRSGGGEARMADAIGELNSVETKLRNVGFNEVGSALPTMGLQIAAPVLAGLLASKTHGATRAALSGAAAGAGIGGFAGPEGMVAGGAIGAGLGLAKQLL